MGQKVRYTVETLASGQPRPYADSEYKCVIAVESLEHGQEQYRPWVLGGDVEAEIHRMNEERRRGSLKGGKSPEQLKKEQHDWAKSVVSVLFHPCREPGDDDGLEDTPDAPFAPTLQSLEVDPKTGTIRAFIKRAFTD